MTLRRSLHAATAIAALTRPGYAVPCQPDNDGTVREAIWRRFDADTGQITQVL